MAIGISGGSFESLEVLADICIRKTEIAALDNQCDDDKIVLGDISRVNNLTTVGRPLPHSFLHGRWKNLLLDYLCDESRSVSLFDWYECLARTSQRVARRQ